MYMCIQLFIFVAYNIIYHTGPYFLLLKKWHVQSIQFKFNIPILHVFCVCTGPYANTEVSRGSSER